MRAHPAHTVGEALRLLRLVVDPFEQRVGERHAPAGTLDVLAGGGEEPVDGHTTGGGDEPAPQLVVRRVQRDGEADL